MIKFRTKYEPRSVRLSFEGVVKRTDPQYLDDCTIEGIIKKYGVLPRPEVQPLHADVSAYTDFGDCLMAVQRGMDEFSSLPSNIRSRFGNSPEAFFAFVCDPSNAQALVDLGLAVKREESPSEIELLQRIADGVTPKGAEKVPTSSASSPTT